MASSSGRVTDSPASDALRLLVCRFLPFFAPGVIFLTVEFANVIEYLFVVAVAAFIRPSLKIARESDNTDA